MKNRVVILALLLVACSLVTERLMWATAQASVGANGACGANAAQNTAANGGLVDARDPCPIQQQSFGSVYGYPNTGLPVLDLDAFVRPADVAGLIVPIIIDTVDGVSGRRLLTHGGHELLEGAESELYPPASVARVGSIVGIVAAVSGPRVPPIYRGLTLSMRVSLLSHGLGEAKFAMLTRPVQGNPGFYRLLAAVATADPFRVSGLRLPCVGNNAPIVNGLTRQVFEADVRGMFRAFRLDGLAHISTV